MKSRPVDPRHLDVETFAKDGDALEGRWLLNTLERLADAAHPDCKPGDDDAAVWHIEGERRAVRGGLFETWLHLRTSARLSLVCQRCLGPVDAPIDAERHFLFVAGEEAAAALDAESEDDVLALTRWLDLRELVEDELLLALPLVPRHDVCPSPLPMHAGDEERAQDQPNPFAALGALKRGGAGV